MEMENKETVPYDENKSLEAIKNIGLTVLELDEDRNKHVERKAEILLGFLGLIIPAVILLYFNIKDQIVLKIFIYKTSFVIIIIFLIITTFLALLVLLTGKFKQIDLNKIYKAEFGNNKISELGAINKSLTDHFLDIHNKNKKIIDRKTAFLFGSFIFAIISLLLVSIFYIVLLFYI